MTLVVTLSNTYANTFCLTPLHDTQLNSILISLFQLNLSKSFSILFFSIPLGQADDNSPWRVGVSPFTPFSPLQTRRESLVKNPGGKKGFLTDRSTETIGTDIRSLLSRDSRYGYYFFLCFSFCSVMIRFYSFFLRFVLFCIILFFILKKINLP